MLRREFFFLPNGTASRPRRLESSTTPVWERRYCRMNLFTSDQTGSLCYFIQHMWPLTRALHPSVRTETGGLTSCRWRCCDCVNVPRGILYSTLCFMKDGQARISFHIDGNDEENVWKYEILRRMIEKCCRMDAFTRVTKYCIKPKILSAVFVNSFWTLWGFGGSNFLMKVEYRDSFEGAFAELRKANISFVVSVRPSVRNNSAATERIFMKFDIWVYFETLSSKLKFLWNRSRITGTLHEKGKAVPLQAWSGPEGSTKLRFPDFMTTAQDAGKVSLTHRPLLPQGNAPGS